MNLIVALVKIILLILCMTFVSSDILISKPLITKLNSRGSAIKKRKTKKFNFKESVKKGFNFKVNTVETFKSVKPQDTFAFLIGNDKYQKKSNFAPLEQCYNDAKLLKQIFVNCLKIDEKRIFVNRDVTYEQFLGNFLEFIRTVKQHPDSNVIITYSGHGDEDGSLVFVDGGKLSPDDLKKLINSFTNDTILMLDACYSGGNEGPKEMFKDKKEAQFKKNSIRIYASLAHLSAKEIRYSNTFFSHIRAFHKNVLKIDKLKGNGYFTAMIGMFFAEYKFKKNENISFNDLVSYVTNRGKQYVEYLALWGKLDKEQGKFAKIRLNQQPKILPISERVALNNDNHQFIFIQKYIQPLGLEPGITGGIFYPMGSFGSVYKKPAIMISLFLGYELDFLVKKRKLFGVLNAHYINMGTVSDSARRDVKLNIFVTSLGVKWYPFTLSFFRMSLMLDAGPAFTLSSASSYGAIKEESNSVTNFYGGADLTLNFEIIKNLNIVLPVKFILIKYVGEPFYGVSGTLGVSYFF